jgi:integrase
VIYPTLSKSIDLYISEVLYYKSDWYERGQKSQLKWWKSKLGSYRLNQVTPSLVKDNLPARSNSTKNRYLTALSCVFNNYYTGDNPVSKIKKFKESRGRVRFLSDTERISLLHHLKNSNHPHIYSIIVLALSTGMRKMEIFKLTKDRVDLSRNLVYLVDTKNNEPRMIPLGGLALELVTQSIDRNPEWCKYVFPTRTYSYYKHTPDAWHRALKAASIKDFTFHCLRHTAASYMAMNGVPILTIAEILGHKDLSTTKRYAHLNIQHLRSTLQGLNNLMFPDSP